MSLNISNLDTERKDAILNAALKEFANKGYDDASTNVIAKESKISKPLMFHYVNSKKELFLFLYDYCTDMINKEYLNLMNFNEKDIFEKLHQSYILQLELLRKYPWIFEFNKLTTLTKSDEINKKIEERVNNKQPFCYETMFSSIDESKFREGLNIEMSKQLIFWGNIGFTNQIMEYIRNSEYTQLIYNEISIKLKAYFDELRNVFYR